MNTFVDPFEIAKGNLTGRKPIEVGGPDSEIVPAEEGCVGMQSPTHYRFDLMDPHAMFALGKVLDEGVKKYGTDNWRHIPTNNHLNKALIHIYAYLAGDTQDEHLEHAFTRLMMALAVKNMEDVK